MTGLKTEARIASGPRIVTLSGCGDVLGLAQRKASAIIGFGVAGGLAMGLAPGTKLVARSVIAEDDARYHSDPVWSQRLANALGRALIADIAGIDLPVAGIAERRALHLKTGALVADTELRSSKIRAKFRSSCGPPMMRAAFVRWSLR